MPKVRKITTRFVQGLEPPATRTDHFDGELTGFHVRVTPKGHKSFGVLYRNGAGKMARYTIGAYPAWPVSRARADARKVLRAVEGGLDPAADRRAERDARWRATEAEMEVTTLGGLVTAFINEWGRGNKVTKAWQDDQTLYQRYIERRMGAVAVRTVSTANIRQLLRHIALQQRKPTTADRVRKLLHRCFTFGLEQGYVQSNPVSGAPKFARSQPRTRALTDDELRRIWTACTDDPKVATRAIQMMLLTGARRTEVLGMQWAEIDEASDVWTIPASRVKNKQPHRVPLSSLALRLLDDIRREQRGHRRFVFPHRVKRNTGAVDVRIAIANVSEAAGVAAHWSAHDLRRTVGSGMSRLGAPLEVVAAVLNHTVPGITMRHYVVHSFDEPKRIWLERWSAHIEQLTGNGSDE